MNVQFVAITTPEQIREVARVAHDIWHEYWPGRIPDGQIDFMVSTMQNVDAIAYDIANNDYRYWFIERDGNRSGYTAACIEDFSNDATNPAATAHGAVINEIALRRLFISKIYLYAHERGRHLCSRTIEFYDDLCNAEGLDVMYLTVNRGNDMAIRAYSGLGFQVIEDVDAQIGQGYVMNDHIMARRIPA